MDDVSPGLLRKIRTAFENNVDNDKKAAKIFSKIDNGTANYRDAGLYAECIGEDLSNAMGKYLSSATLPDGKLYWHIARDVLEPLMSEEYSIISIVAKETQKGLNAAAGMGLQPIKAKYDKAAVENILGMASNAEQYDDIAVELGETMVTFGRDIVDQTLKANIEFKGESGRLTRVIRTAGAECCPWCADLEGTYEYPNVPDDVYKHHDYCKCDLEYEDVYGRSTVWSAPKTDPKVLEERKTFGL